jgi:hypothetical protein
MSFKPAASCFGSWTSQPMARRAGRSACSHSASAFGTQVDRGETVEPTRLTLAEVVADYFAAAGAAATSRSQQRSLRRSAPAWIFTCRSGCAGTASTTGRRRGPPQAQSTSSRRRSSERRSCTSSRQSGSEQVAQVVALRRGPVVCVGREDRLHAIPDKARDTHGIGSRPNQRRDRSVHNARKALARAIKAAGIEYDKETHCVSFHCLR